MLVPFNDTGAESLGAVLTTSCVTLLYSVTFSKKLPNVLGGELPAIMTACELFPFNLHRTDPLVAVAQINTSSSPGHMYVTVDMML